jgi:hypothetical protein
LLQARARRADALGARAARRALLLGPEEAP